MSENQYKGVDISYCQAGISYEALKNAGVCFAFIRAGFSDTEDSLLDTHVRGCCDMGIAYGFYWYSYAYSIHDAKIEAAACIKAVNRYAPTLPVFFDMEEPSQIDRLDSDTRTDIAVTFCEELKKAGINAGVYANPSFLESYYRKNRLVGVYPIWLAHWTGGAEYPSRYNYGQRFWQYGITRIGNMFVDADIMFADEPPKASPVSDAGTTGSEMPAEPETSAAPFVVGDKVRVKDGAAAYDGTPLAAFVYNNIYEVMQVGTRSFPDYIVIGQGGIITAAVRAELLYPAEEPVKEKEENEKDLPQKLAVGDKATVKEGAKTYGGTPLASFVYKNTYDVMQVGTRSFPDYIVIGQGGAVTAAVKAADLTVISSAS